MYCNNCGKEIENGTAFCPNCGNAIANEQQQQPITEDNGKKILTKGILAVAFTCSFWLSFLGIIFGAQGKAAAKKFEKQTGKLFGKAKVGSILSNVGFGVGIGLTILAVIYIIIFAVMGFGESQLLNLYF